MPQMAPMWWTTLFSIFIISFILIMMVMYFNKMYSLSTQEMNKAPVEKNISWKW